MLDTINLIEAWACSASGQHIGIINKIARRRLYLLNRIL